MVDFAAESVDVEVAEDSDDPEFAEESEAAGLVSLFLVSPLLSAPATLVSDELLSDVLSPAEPAADLGA